MNRIVDLSLFTGSANPPLGEAIAQQLGTTMGRSTLERFPDDELQVEVQESVRDRDVYIVQPTSPSVGEHLLELLLLADACARAGAARLTAVIPYFGYARQDRRATGRDPVAARVVADLLQTSSLRRVIALDLHTVSLEGFFAIPLEHMSATPLLVEALRPHVEANSVVVSPDLGAVKLAERYGSLLGLPVATVYKTRLSGEDVRAEQILGEVAGRAPIVIDDMISTAATIEAAINALIVAGSGREAVVAATHGLLVGRAAERLSALPIKRLILTDSVRPHGDPRTPMETVSVAPLLAQAINRLNRGLSLDDLITHR